MPKHIYITKEMLESKLESVSVRDLAKTWCVSESTIIRTQKKYGLVRSPNYKISSKKIKKYSVSTESLTECDDTLSYIFGFLYARARIFKSSLIIQCPISENSKEILRLIQTRFKSTYPIIQTKKSLKLVIRDEEFIKKLIDLKIINSPVYPEVSNVKLFESGISTSMSFSNTIISDRNEKIIELLKNHSVSEVSKLMNISVGRIRKIKNKFKLLNLLT